LLADKENYSEILVESHVDQTFLAGPVQGRRLAEKKKERDVPLREILQVQVRDGNTLFLSKAASTGTKGSLEGDSRTDLTTTRHVVAERKVKSTSGNHGSISEKPRAPEVPKQKEKCERSSREHDSERVWRR